jgi:two-component sensor histidine kinase
MKGPRRPAAGRGARRGKAFVIAFAAIVVSLALIVAFAYTNTLALGGLVDRQQSFFVKNITDQSASLYRVVFSLDDLLRYADSAGGRPDFQRLAELCRSTLNHASIPEIVDPSALSPILGDDPLLLGERLGESNEAYRSSVERIAALLEEAQAEAAGQERTRSLAALVESARSFGGVLKERLQLLIQIEDAYQSATHENLARLSDMNHAMILEFSLLIAAMVGVAALYFRSRLRIERELEAHRDHLADLVAERTTELALANTRLSERLAEREILIREVHHRVKNNLAMILGLIALQRRAPGTVGDELGRALDDLASRVQAIVTIHDRLYRSENLGTVGFRDYIGSLCRTLVETLSPPDVAIAVDIDAGEISLPVDALLTIGLMVSEIVTNSMKHAFKGRSRGRILVVLTEADGIMRLEASDDGVPPPSADVFLSSRTLGSTLVQSFAAQLRGSVRYEIGAGTRAIIEFPRPVPALGPA